VLTLSFYFFPNPSQVSTLEKKKVPSKSKRKNNLKKRRTIQEERKKKGENERKNGDALRKQQNCVTRNPAENPNSTATLGIGLSLEREA
jgi:hypothetical protein